MNNTASPGGHVNRSLLAMRALAGTVMVGLGPITVLASNGTVALVALLALMVRRSGFSRLLGCSRDDSLFLLVEWSKTHGLLLDRHYAGIDSVSEIEPEPAVMQ